ARVRAAVVRHEAKICSAIEAWIRGRKSRYMRMDGGTVPPARIHHWGSMPPPATASAVASEAKLSIGFINWAHALDHYVMLIFPTVVIGLEIVYGRSYAELIALGTPAFLAFG